MKATHMFRDGFPVVVEPGPDEHTAKITYVGPRVPGNRKLGETRLASTTDFDGNPVLIPIDPADERR